VCECVFVCMHIGKAIVFTSQETQQSLLNPDMRQTAKNLHAHTRDER